MAGSVQLAPAQLACDTGSVITAMQALAAGQAGCEESSGGLQSLWEAAVTTFRLHQKDTRFCSQVLGPVRPGGPSDWWHLNS